MKQHFAALSVQLLQRWFRDVQPGPVVEKNRARSVDERQLQGLQLYIRKPDCKVICGFLTGGGLTPQS